jgi:Tol biopolymer transport system component
MDVSPDGRWVLYGSVTDASLYRSATEGGTPVKLADTLLGGSQFSPDGKRVVFETFLPGKDRLVRSLAVIPSEGGKPLKTLPFPEGADVRWSPGGDALTYVLDAGGVSNLWRQPLDGSAPKQITDFKSDRIFAYDWSEDGRRIFLSRGSETRDVVLIRDFR